MPWPRPPLLVPRESPARLSNQLCGPPSMVPRCRVRPRRLRSLAATRGTTAFTNARRLERNALSLPSSHLLLAPRIFLSRARCRHNVMLRRDRTVRFRVVFRDAPAALLFFATSASAGAITTATGSVGAIAAHVVAAAPCRPSKQPQALQAPLRRTPCDVHCGRGRCNDTCCDQGAVMMPLSPESAWR